MRTRLSAEDLEVLRKLRRLLKELGADEMRIFEYVWDNISVGEIVFARDLEQVYGIKRPHIVVRRLRELGLVERGEGCYNLARWLRGLRRRISSFALLSRLMEAAT